jgi:hypothetical protein
VDIEEYKKQLDEMHRRHRQEEKELAARYVESINVVKVGDMVTDHMQTIKVEEVTPYGNVSSPSCYYTGPRYAKTGLPFKSGERANVFLFNVKKHTPAADL